MHEELINRLTDAIELAISFKAKTDYWAKETVAQLHASPLYLELSRTAKAAWIERTKWTKSVERPIDPDVLAKVESASGEYVAIDGVKAVKKAAAPKKKKEVNDGGTGEHDPGNGQAASEE